MARKSAWKWCRRAFKPPGAKNPTRGSQKSHRGKRFPPPREVKSPTGGDALCHRGRSLTPTDGRLRYLETCCSCSVCRKVASVEQRRPIRAGSVPTSFLRLSDDGRAAALRPARRDSPPCSLRLSALLDETLRPTCIRVRRRVVWSTAESCVEYGGELCGARRSVGKVRSESRSVMGGEGACPNGRAWFNPLTSVVQSIDALASIHRRASVDPLTSSR